MVILYGYMLSEKQIAKIKKVQEELRRFLLDSDKETLFLDYLKLKNIPLLNDQMGLINILNTIQEKSNNKVSWREVMGQRKYPQTASNPEPEFTPLIPIGVEIHVEDPLYIDKYFEFLLKNSTEESEVEIKNLDIIKHEDGSNITVIINEKYLEENVQPLSKKGRWKVLIEIAEEGSVKTESEREAKSIVEYFNTNKKCMIYSRYPKYKLSKILKADGQNIYPNLKIKILSKKAFSTRKKILKKT
jgi:hypothetical protein